MRTVIRLFVAGGVVTLLSGAAITATPQEEPFFDRAALCTFEDRVAQYAALHRELEALLPPLEPSTDPGLLVTHRSQLAAAIKSARPNARQGDLFTASVGYVFRGLIAEALLGRDVETLLRDLFEEEHPETWGYRLGVYDSYPDWATREVPAILLQQLPDLPEAFEYRVVDHDLAILDIGQTWLLTFCQPRSGVAIPDRRHFDAKGEMIMTMRVAVCRSTSRESGSISKWSRPGSLVRSQ